jgi:hypothetical protein
MTVEGKVVKPRFRQSPEAAAAPVLPEVEDAGLVRQRALGYWTARRGMLYYQAILQYAAIAGYVAKSAIDVGSGGTDYINWLHWIPDRYILDFKVPKPPQGVHVLETDFMEYKPPSKFDLVMCCQVLEHVEEPRAFCAKLKELGSNLIISVPYKWSGRAPGHINDPVDEQKLLRWMGVQPNNAQVVYEPFREGRLIAYYDLVNGPLHRFPKEFVIAALAERLGDGADGDLRLTKAGKS